MTPDPEVRRSRFCIRGPEECEGIAEPEEDGEVTFWKCTTCEQEFGYQVTGSGDPDCQLGVPEAVRRMYGKAETLLPGSPLPLGPGTTFEGINVVVDPAQPSGVVSLESETDRRSVFLGPVIRRRAE